MKNNNLRKKKLILEPKSRQNLKLKPKTELKQNQNLRMKLLRLLLT